jgi:hypothetical protein
MRLIKDRPGIGWVIDKVCLRMDDRKCIMRWMMFEVKQLLQRWMGDRQGLSSDIPLTIYYALDDV